MSLTNHGENLLLNWLLTANAAVRPTSWFIGLSTADPTEDGSGLAEPADPAYDRLAVAFTVTDDTAENSGTLEFAEATVSWGSITHYALFDAASGGNMIAHGSLTVAKNISAGDVARFIPGSIVMTMA